MGDKEVRVQQGDLVVKPKGAAHGWTKPDGRTLGAVAIKMRRRRRMMRRMLN